MFNIEEIKELMQLLEDSSLAVMEVKSGDHKVRLEKPAAPVQPAPAAVSVQTPAAVSVQATAVTTPVADSGKTITAPIVGVFYAAPSPDSDPYVSVGKRVKKGDVVCIIEAMKCMNEIQAEEDGEITAVLATNGELVEYGQPLFAIQ